MEFTKLKINVNRVGWSDSVGQSFSTSIKYEVNRFNKAQDKASEALSRVVSYDPNTLTYTSKYEAIESLRKK